MENTKNTKWLVQSGKDVVNLHRYGLTKEEATSLEKELKESGHKHVRVRREDPHYPSWPQEFDAEKEERIRLIREAKQKKNEKSND
jgi:hypothetical protein